MGRRNLIERFEMPEGVKAAARSMARACKRDGYGFFASAQFEDGEPTTMYVSNGHDKPVKLELHEGEWWIYEEVE